MAARADGMIVGGHRFSASFPTVRRYRLAREQASFKKQSPACAAGLVICAETTRYFTEGTFPNWLSNGL
jgi:hypothetical protein